MTESDMPSLDSPSSSDTARGYRGDRTWVLGLALIVVGAVLLAQQLIGLRLVNWWALILLIPAFGAFESAVRRYHKRGTAFSGSVTGSFVTGLSLLAVTVIFLFGLDWSTIWPIFIILAGIGALLGAIFR
jgi:drug/metabolite transporter (DMT)-like permease